MYGRSEKELFDKIFLKVSGQLMKNKRLNPKNTFDTGALHASLSTASMSTIYKFSLINNFDIFFCLTSITPWIPVGFNVK